MEATIAVTCQSCGNEFEPTTGADRPGHWHTCPLLRGDPDRKVSGDLVDHSGAATVQINGALCQPESAHRA